MSKNKTLVVLDVGLSQPLHGKSFDQITSQGEILSLPLSLGQKTCTRLLRNQDQVKLPDGVVYDGKSDRLIYTNMGIPPLNDGSVYSVRTDGSDPRPVLPKGSVHTPKQLALDSVNGYIYVSDREGLRVMRCKLDGSELETLITTGDASCLTDARDQTKWCVGITVSNRSGRFYWTQKGNSKSNTGRIFSAPIESIDGKRTPVLLLDSLPEPIDLEIDDRTNTLYWTDRGELPYGNTFNRVALDAEGAHLESARKNSEGLHHEILTQNFNETIGLVMDREARKWYVADMGGSVYSMDEDGRNRQVVFNDPSRSFTGITLVSN